MFMNDINVYYFSSFFWIINLLNYKGDKVVIHMNVMAFQFVFELRGKKNYARIT